MIKQILAAIGIFIVLVIVGFVFNRLSGLGGKTAEIKIGNAVFKVEIADTSATRALGLSGREFLKPDAGVLFIFPEAEIQKFWMKDMKFPIDIIWIRDNKVIGMVIGAEPEAGPDYTIYNSPEPADMVLEMNAGLSQKLGIRIGDMVKLE
jgi:uncharacterized membrane protein (UPF0127 family)